MATQAQIAANRRNAQLSTGPRTEAGKSNARRNRLQSGLYAESLLIPGEDPAELDALAAEYEAEYRPATATERDLVAMLVRSQWYMRRVSCIETDMWTIMLDDSDAMSEARRTNRRPKLHTAFEHFEMSLSRIQVRLNSLDRSFHRALTLLRGLPSAILHTPRPCRPRRA
ncbi:MAG TPA: hypothetical protein VKX45_12370 [Bryobacteraceae bacterium]|jgi:hypothetical protein|nr:hypothetical protein [Bryobacteraceae bacterium]